LPDGEGGFDTDSENAEVIAPDQLVTFGQLCAGDPGLAFPIHELPLVFADRA
jgi:hypothetical protein